MSDLSCPIVMEYWDTYQHGKPAKGKVCRLPDCEKSTRHNAGYCCADHCKEHTVIRRKERFPDERTERINAIEDLTDALCSYTGMCNCKHPHCSKCKESMSNTAMIEKYRDLIKKSKGES